MDHSEDQSFLACYKHMTASPKYLILPHPSLSFRACGGKSSSPPRGYMAILRPVTWLTRGEYRSGKESKQSVRVRNINDESGRK